MQQIWAPWRSVYISRQDHDEECIFCKKLSSDCDEENHILLRAKEVFVLLNLYPYNNGHLLIVPKRHVGELEELEEQEMLEMFFVTRRMVKALKTFNPEGFNIGVNLGRTAGAGIPSHFHVHIVPRWNGDTNFMPVLGNVKVISESLELTYQKLKAVLENT